MLHLAHRLAIDPTQGLSVVPLRSKTWKPLVVVPRELCVFESLPCSGLAWYERRQFARTQAGRLAPFKSYGCNAAVTGNRLMLWFWDQDEVGTALRDAGFDVGVANCLVESLLRKPRLTDGDDAVACWNGVDKRAMTGGAVVASKWEKSDLPAVTNLDDVASRPWVRELLQDGQNALQRNTLDTLVARRNILPQASLMLVTAVAGYAAYWGATYYGTQHRLTRVEATATEADRTIGDLLALKQSSDTTAKWIDNYSRLAASVTLDRLLNALSGVMAQNGVVIREFELRKDEVRLALSSAGGDIDLPRLLEQLSQLPGVTDVQVRDNVELTQVGFNLRVPGFVAVLVPPSPDESTLQR